MLSNSYNLWLKCVRIFKDFIVKTQLIKIIERNNLKIGLKWHSIAMENFKTIQR